MPRFERPTGRRWVTLGVLGAIVLGVALWWFAHEPQAGEGEEPGLHARERELDRSAALLADRQREGAPVLLGTTATERSDGVVGTELPFLEAEEPVAAPPPREVAGAAAVLHVTIRFPEAWRGLDGVVYALPAGSPGRDGEQTLPHVAVRLSADDVTLPLPEEGAWDVGFRGEYGHVLLEGVDARGITDVVIDARSAAPIRFFVRGGEHPPTWISVRGEGVDFPGRGQWAPVHWSETLREGRELHTPPLASGRSHGIKSRTPVESVAPGGIPGYELVPVRETARAGEDVELVLARLGLLRVTPEIDPTLPEKWLKDWSTDIYLMAGAQGERDREPLRFASTYLRKDGSFKDPVLLLPLAPGRHSLHMFPTPHLFQGAPMPIQIVAGETLDVRVRATPDSRWNPFGPTILEETPRTDLRLQLSPPSAATWFVAGEVEEDARLRWGGWGQGTDAEVEVSGTPVVRRVLVFVPPDRASDVVQVPLRGTVRVPLRPAGHLVLVPEVLPDPRLGAFQVRRADGLPLPRPDPQLASAQANPERYRLEYETLPALTMGLVLGPLPEGPLQLEVLLGGTVIARPVAPVHAGRHTPVSIPVRAGPDR